jgi:hypothetical protein
LDVVLDSWPIAVGPFLGPLNQSRMFKHRE